MERPTSAEPVGGDTSSTSHLSPTSNRLFIHPSSEAVHPTTHSDLNAPTSTSERPSMFQGSVTPSPTVRQWTLDIAKESHQEDLGGDRLPSDLSQQGTITATHSSLEGPVPTCLLNVTQELLQQVTPEHTSPGSVPPEPIAQQQTQYEGYALQASECDRSADPCLQASHIAPKNSQQEPVSASPPGQYKLCLAASISLSPSASTEISSGSVQVHVSIQHKPFNQTEACKQGAESGISTNEIIANPGETSGRFSMVEPAQLTQVGGVEQSGPGTGGQDTEVSSPSSCHDRKAPLSQDLIVGTGPSIGLTKIEKTQLSLKSSNLLCGLVTGPLEKTLSGDALNISPLQSSQMQVTSHQVTHQGLEHAASKGNMATGQEDRGSGSFASSPQHVPEESQMDNTQASDAGHLCFSSSLAQQEARALGSRQRLEEWEDRETEELGCRWQKKKETGEKEATDSGVMENTGFTNPNTSPSVEPHKGPASEEVVMDGLDDNGSLTNAGSTVLPHFSHSSSHRNTTHTLQFHALKETNILHVVQTATRRETCTLQMLQSLTQNEASPTHAGPAHRDGQYCLTGQNQLRHNSDVRTCSSDWGMYRGLCPPLSPPQQGHTTEACPLPVVTSQLGSKTVHKAVCHNISWGTSTPPLQPVGSGVQREAVGEATQTNAKSTAESSEQPTPASTHSVPSQSSIMSCSPSMSMRSAEVSTRAPPNSLEEADTSSSDDEGRLVIELE
ncbi:hypothetical protein GJAV_G00172750 [Gymnothorax javanicus]|nr:hypothetical protein GJAV_G00172750 [Gymnothorax javanicus]